MTAPEREGRERPMPLGEALHLLARAHTANDEQSGFVVHSTAHCDPDRSQREYVRAWAAVRYAIGLPTEREDYGR